MVFSGEATLALAQLAYSETFKGCTARGVAEGASALRLELYSDLLLALKTGAPGGDAEGAVLLPTFNVFWDAHTVRVSTPRVAATTTTSHMACAKMVARTPP